MTETLVMPLTAADRCDKCQAAARTRVTLLGGLDLMFCKHHADAYAPEIRAVGVKIHTEDVNL